MALPWKTRKYEGEVVKRQLDIPKVTYTSADSLMENENKRLGFVTRSEKYFLNEFLVMLIADGISHRERKIYVPEDRQQALEKNEKWCKLKAAADSAVEKLRSLEEKLLQSS